MSNNVKYSCIYCNKIYIRKFAFNNHLAKCKLNNNIKVTTSNSEYKMQYNKSISNEVIFNMLLDLNNKYEKLQANYDELKKYTNIIKNKISILDYLNNNYQNLRIDFIDFTKLINISLEEINIIFKKDYIEGIIEIIINNINKLKTNETIIPIKGFNQKENNLYIYLKNINCWKLMEINEFNNFIHYFNKNILNIFARWNENAKLTLNNEDYSDLYVINMKKVIGGNFEKKNINNILKNKLYKHLKCDLKKVISYDFI